MAKKRKRPHGHYCKICGQHKANEKFSGRGHAAHICKACSGLSAVEKSEAQTINRLMSLPFHRLNDGEKKWLKNRTHDKRPEVAETAREIYRECFPFAERNARKKQLIINTLDFEIHTDVYQEYGEWENVDHHFTASRKERTVTFADASKGGPDQKVVLDGGKMAKLLRWAVHSLEIFMWPEDYCLSCTGEDSPDSLKDELPDIFDGIEPELWDGEDGEDDGGDWDEFLEFEDGEEEKGNPSWRVCVEYSDGTRQDMSCYDGQLDGRPEQLYFRLLEYFETEEDWLMEELRMLEYSISETTKEEREQIVADALGNISAYCDGCMLGLAEMYQDYIDGKKEIREINMEFQARYVSGEDGPAQGGSCGFC